jgi:hypothetical protein
VASLWDYNNAAESSSSNSTACFCVRKKDAGQFWLIGSFRALRIACALRVSGAIHTIFRTAHNVGIVSALGDVLILLLGFIAGGFGWYMHDVRLRARHPERIEEERIIFSFIVFVLIPLSVLALVFVIWLVSLFIGG